MAAILMVRTCAVMHITVWSDGQYLSVRQMAGQEILYAAI